MAEMRMLEIPGSTREGPPDRALLCNIGITSSRHLAIAVAGGGTDLSRPVPKSRFDGDEGPVRDRTGEASALLAGHAMAPNPLSARSQS